MVSTGRPSSSARCSSSAGSCMRCAPGGAGGNRSEGVAGSRWLAVQTPHTSANTRPITPPPLRSRRSAVAGQHAHSCSPTAALLAAHATPKHRT